MWQYGSQKVTLSFAVKISNRVYPVSPSSIMEKIGKKSRALKNLILAGFSVYNSIKNKHLKTANLQNLSAFFNPFSGSIRSTTEIIAVSLYFLTNNSLYFLQET